MIASVSSNWLRILVSIAVAYLLTPYVLHQLGNSGNDLWSMINASVGLLGLLLLGVPMTSVRFFAEHVAKKDISGLNRSIATSLGMYLILGALAMVIGAGIWAFFHLLYEVPPEFEGETQVALALMIVYVGSGFVSQLPYGVLSAHNDFGVSNLIQMSAMLVRLGATWVALVRAPTLVTLALIQLVISALEFAVGWLVVVRRYPGVRLGLREFDRVVVRRIIGFSVFVLLLNVGNKLAFHIDSLVIGAFLDKGAVTDFSLGNQFMIYLTDLILGIGMVVMPLAVRLKTQGKSEEIRDIFLKWSRITVSICLLVSTYLMIAGPAFIGWWVGAEHQEAAGTVLQILVPSFVLFLASRGVALPILMGRGDAAFPAWALLGMGLLNLAMSLALVRPFGIVGVAIGTAVPNVAFAAAIAVRCCRELQVPLTRYFSYVFARPFLGSAPIVLALFLYDQASPIFGFTRLFLSGLCTVGLFGLVWIFFVYRGDPYLDLRGRLSSLLRRLRRRAATEPRA